ncbi:MAG: DUF72 domain-containing protein [Betaproteobacteria bacterium]|nr:DUF72 domain-containing protein [Betaproteobacteria bacterium]
MSTIHLGTSGWSYAHWVGPFYPAAVPRSQWLAYYASHLESVEINNTFYRLPSAETIASWHDATPTHFLFAVKASRFITHVKRLREPSQTLSPFLERVTHLQGKLGPILFQLPPRFPSSPDRLAGFLRALPAGLAYAFEFRDRSWFNDRTYGLLAERNAALCIYELNGQTPSLEATARFVYVRLHGPDGPYRGGYDEARLAHWAERCRAWTQEHRDVFLYFDNDEAGHAPRDALALAGLLARDKAGVR